MFAFENNREFAILCDRQDSLASFRDQFYIPSHKEGKCIYLCGNSLGLQPISTESYIKQELDDWRNYGVEGHFHAKHPWMPYHEFLTEAMAEVVGALPKEVVVMNTLSVNLHLMMVSFYRPNASRYKILIEKDAFPSDRYAVASQIRYHGYEVSDALLELAPRPGETCIRKEDIDEMIEHEGHSIALILLGNTNYYTGQYFDMKHIAQLGHMYGCMVGFDCAHGAGNLPLHLHDSGADFAVWCSYKYLNSGPGSIAACFVHERHTNVPIPRFEGWWGHNKMTRFGMRDDFDAIPSAEAWQLSNPPILSLAAVMASLHIFQKAGIHNLREKSIKLTSYLEYLIQNIESDRITIITPPNSDARGAQLSIQVKNADKALYHSITDQGVIADWREPDVIRVAPVPLYNSYEDVYRFSEILKNSISNGK